MHGKKTLLMLVLAAIILPNRYWKRRRSFLEETARSLAWSASALVSPKVINYKALNTLTRIIPMNAIKTLAKVETECQSTSTDVQKRFKDVPKFYFSLNVEQGLQDTEMDEWKKRTDAVTHTRKYLKGEDTNKKVDSVVQALQTRPVRLKASG